MTHNISFIKAELEGGACQLAGRQSVLQTRQFSPINENIETPDHTCESDHVEGNAAAQFSSLHPTHV